MRANWNLKIFPIAGDLSLKRLGISEIHREVLLKEVQIFINCAASVNFDDPLMDALNINYFGVMRVMELA
jgi:fatty acyl-CoA reductase